MGYKTNKEENNKIQELQVASKSEDYFREQLMLYCPWRNEENDPIRINHQETFDLYKDSIKGLNTRTEKVEYFNVPKIIPDIDYQQMIRGFNTNQRKYTLNVMNLVNKEGAGVEAATFIKRYISRY